MFKPEECRIFGLAPGVDFPAALIDGLKSRLSEQPPEAMARVELIVNTRRMERRLRQLFDQSGAQFLPRLRLVSDFGPHPALAGLPKPYAPLDTRLELSRLVAGLLATEPELAPQSALFDLSDSIASLMEEMQGEGVTFAALKALDVGQLSAHWQRSLNVLSIVEQYFDTAMSAPSPAGVQRLTAGALAAHWAAHPPKTPVIVAGSTGSRGATALLMQAVARLPQGALVLPGFDFDQPAAVWDGLADTLESEDHPQYRFRLLLDGLQHKAGDVRPWVDTPPHDPARNRVVSLALRPAPVTDQWMDEGRALRDLGPAMAGVSLIEAPSPGLEAKAIALRLRAAVESGTRAALISPDRMLTRQVAAELQRWGIVPDDSAGTPLAQSPPGRFLRLVATMIGRDLDSAALLAVLKHPLCASGGDRGQHLLHTRDLELAMRRDRQTFAHMRDLFAWAETARGTDDGGAGHRAARSTWITWLCAALEPLFDPHPRSLSDIVQRHLSAARHLATGPGGRENGTLWDKAAGIEALTSMQDITRAAPAAGDIPAPIYVAQFNAMLRGREVRDPVQAHGGVMFWGTLEARVQGADLVILGGLNEGSWPEMPKPDPWLNRDMRHALGLLLPDRQIGLAAHDFQQAIAAPEVVLSRAARDAETPTVPSRWLNRLLNLLSGLPDQGGAVALADMRRRGGYWSDLAAGLDQPDETMPPAPRPAPAPPVDDRPRRLSVTAVQRLIRDPYAIYAERILQLRALDPIRAQPDAPLRGTVLHEILERFVRDGPKPDSPDAQSALMHLADETLRSQVPWPAARRLWRARILRAADGFLAWDSQRRQMGTPLFLEQKGSITLENGFLLTAEADRIDRLTDGRLAIFDYKSGSPPSKKQIRHYDKQLLLEAVIAQAGGFADIGVAEVAELSYFFLGKASEAAIDTADYSPDQALSDLIRLLRAYGQRDKGYAARRAMFTTQDKSDFDHLSRFGEWDISQAPQTIMVGP